MARHNRRITREGRYLLLAVSAGLLGYGTTTVIPTAHNHPTTVAVAPPLGLLPPAQSPTRTPNPPTPAPPTAPPARTSTTPVASSSPPSGAATSAPTHSPTPTVRTPAAPTTTHAPPPPPAPKPKPPPTPAPTPQPPTNPSTRARFLAWVREQVGKPYSWGGVGPNSFDCSGLVQTGLSTVGVHVQRTAAQQSATAGVYESISDAQPGDLLFWNGVGSSGHVAVYIGGGMFIGAQNESTGVAVVSLSWDRPLFARRVL